MTFPSSDNFSKHAANYREVKRSLIQLELAHKAAIRNGNDAATASLARAHYLHVGIYAEARLRVIVDDPTGFSESQRREVWSKRSQKDRWVKAVSVAANSHYQVSNLNSPPPESDPTTVDRILQVKGYLEADLAGAIIDRNKIAHGQWLHQLKSGSDDRFLASPRTINFNYLEIVRQYNLLTDISELVHILVVSATTFERDCELILDSIWRHANAAPNDEYESFSEKLRSRNRKKQ